MKQKTIKICFVAVLLLVTGCGSGANMLKHFHSAMTGLDRKIMLYDCSGHVIKEWRTTAQVEDRGGSVYFIINGKAVTVAGTFVIEEQ